MTRDTSPNHAMFGVGIQPEPCYRGGGVERDHVVHNNPFVVDDETDNLAGAWRSRICSFTESLNRSTHQVVRFSIYQQRTPRRAFGLFDNVWSAPRPAGAESLSLGR